MEKQIINNLVTAFILFNVNMPHKNNKVKSQRCILNSLYDQFETRIN